LKDGVGSSSYAIYLPGDTTPVIYGYSAELQPGGDASSTRQELLGQLGLEYWIDALHVQWGRPRGNLRVTLVTDSKASIEVMQNVPKAIGVGAMLKADMDIALEIFSLQLKTSWLERETIKVTSHIDKDEAPDEFLWECNAFVDALATKSREVSIVQELTSRKSYIFPGAKIGCSINGRVENNGLYRKLQYKITGSELRQYFTQKYDWNQGTFKKIAWEAHGKEFINYPRNKVVTLTKFIHGWLANQKKSFHEGRTRTAQCPLCGCEDNREHFFRCRETQLTQIRTGLWTKLYTDVAQTTEKGCKEIFIAGLSTVMGREPPTDREKQSWPEELQVAFDSQTEIGWTQVFYGRISTLWEKLARSSDDASSHARSSPWTSKVIRWCWGFGIDLWHARNEIVHGTDGSISKYEKQRLRAKVSAMYRELRPQVRHRMTDIFSITEAEMLDQPVQNQVAWLERLKFLFHEQYVEIIKETEGNLRSDQETELQQLRAIGMSLG